VVERGSGSATEYRHERDDDEHGAEETEAPQCLHPQTVLRFRRRFALYRSHESRLPPPVDAHSRRKAISSFPARRAAVQVRAGDHGCRCPQVCRVSTREPLGHDERRHVDAYREDGSSGEVANIRETAGRLANGESVGDQDPIRVLAGLVQQLAAEVARGGGNSPDHGPTAPLDGAPED